MEHFWKETSLKLNCSSENNCNSRIKIKEEPIEANSNITPAQENQSEVNDYFSRDQNRINKPKLECFRCFDNKFYRLKSRVFKSKLSLRAHLIKHKYEKIKTKTQEKQGIKSKMAKVVLSSINIIKNSQPLMRNKKAIRGNSVKTFFKKNSNSFKQIKKSISIHKQFQISKTFEKAIKNKFESDWKSKKLSDKKIHSKERKFQCDQCEQKCNRSGDLIKHKRIHTGEKPFECDQCNKKFKRSDHLKIHKRIHTGEKPYECDQCEKKFSILGNLKGQKQIHTRQNEFECEQCKKKFSNSGHLTIHKRIHTGEKPYECNQCEMKFKIPSSLAKHERIHTGEKPFECDQCKKKFSNSSNLTVHKRIHTGEKPYECNQCEKKFSDPRTLKKHKRIHTGEKPFECDQCKRNSHDQML